VMSFYPLPMQKRPKAEPIRNPTPFAMDKLENPADLATKHEEVEREFHAPGLLLGTSSFTATGWQGTFYPAGMKPPDCLSFYATRFQTVEVDSTYYGPPSASTVTGWRDKTPPDFLFAAKVPQAITHEKVLVDCEAQQEEIRVHLLRE
jgi:hypothetical protein